MLNGLALFAGVGGIELGIGKCVRTVCYVEKNPYAVGVIRSRIEEGRLPEAPIWDDVKTFDGKSWFGLVDIISGGFPCQDISVAGKGRGIKKDTRSGLWFQMLRIINEVRPGFVFVENVSALTKRGLDIVLGQLSEAGYDARWTDLRASDVGARHKRERVFILAYTRDCTNRTEQRQVREEKEIQGVSRETLCTRMPSRTGKDVANSECNGASEGNRYEIGGGEEKKQHHDKLICSSKRDVANSNRKRLQRRYEEYAREGASGFGSGVWQQDPAEEDPSSESYVGRVADGIPKRVDRIKCLGNAVVPEQARKAWEILTEGE